MPIWLIKYWHFIAIGLLAISALHLQGRAVHWHDQTELCESNRKADRLTYEKASAQAKANNLEAVRTTEQKWQEVVEENERTYDAKLDSAYASVADYAKRLRAGNSTTYQGDTRSSSLSEASRTSEASLGASSNSLIPVPEGDLRICAANTLKAQDWQTFYKGLRAP